MSPLALGVSQTFLAHAVLAHISPEVSTLDRILSLQSRRALHVADSDNKTTLVSLPAEVLLIVRSFLLPAVTDSLLAETTAAYADSLLAPARRLCSECLAYNARVYGCDALVWPESRPGLQQANTNLLHGCECGRGSARNDLHVANWREWAQSTALVLGAHKDTFEHRGGKRGHKRQHSHSAESASWLENYLTRRAARGVPIRRVIEDILASDFGLELDQQPTTRPSSSKADVPDAVSLISASSLSSCAVPTQADRLSIVARELALSGSLTAGSEILTLARDMAAAFIAETAAGVARSSSRKSSSAVPPRASNSGVGAIIASIALGAYALSRLGVF